MTKDPITHIHIRPSPNPPTFSIDITRTTGRNTTYGTYTTIHEALHYATLIAQGRW